MEFECEPECDGDPAYSHSDNCPSRTIKDANRRLARNQHEPQCKVPFGGSECSCNR